MQGRVLVIGGGVGGMAAALSLADTGFEVYLVEREAFIGGKAALFACKATDKCAACGVCLVPDVLSRTIISPKISLLIRSTLVGLTKRHSGFRAEIVQQQAHIDPDACIACGACLEVCPTGAIRLPFPGATPCTYFIEEDKCILLKGERCDLCRVRCPTGAVSLDQGLKKLDLDVDAVIVATGFEVPDAREKEPLGYGRHANVLTGLDLERIFSREGTLRLPDGKQHKDIAFVQCVGSRDESRGRGYCSQVCCKYATKLARLIKYENLRANVTIFCIDLQTAGKGFAEFFEECQETVRLVRGIPSEVTKTPEGNLKVRFEDFSQARQAEQVFDLVVLSVGIAPRKDSWDLARILGINLDPFGFFDSVNEVETNVDGIFVAGTCRGPRDIPESIADGTAAAKRVVGSLLRRQEIKTISGVS